MYKFFDYVFTRLDVIIPISLGTFLAFSYTRFSATIDTSVGSCFASVPSELSLSPEPFSFKIIYNEGGYFAYKQTRIGSKYYYGVPRIKDKNLWSTAYYENIVCPDNKLEQAPDEAEDYYDKYIDLIKVKLQ